MRKTLNYRIPLIAHISNENVAGQRINLRGFGKSYLNAGVYLKDAILNIEIKIHYN